MSLAEQAKPNVLFILSDDQAWTDYGFMGHQEIKTPQIDKLAAASVVFERGYVAAPLCRPSLASMLTGRYPFDHGVTGNDVDGTRQRAELDIPVRKKFHQFPSFVKLLTANGYLAHQSGKWWEGSHKDGGFTHGMTHGDPKRGGRHGDAGLSIGREGIKPITDFLDLATAEKKPFLLWYAPILPHTPHTPPDRLLAKYTRPGVASDVAKYYAMCELFDETCGQVLKELDDRDLRKNTIIIYICDNGWSATSTNAADPNQKAWKGYALRSKSSPFEGGIRTPIMISWPGHITPERSPDLAHAIDIFPTIAAAVGMTPPEKLPGINLMDATARQQRNAVFGVCNSTHNMTPEQTDGCLHYLWCVSGDYKLLIRYPGSDTTEYKVINAWDQLPVRLYNLKIDPHEKNEISASHPDIVKSLREKIETWHPVTAKFTSQTSIPQVEAQPLQPADLSKLPAGTESLDLFLLIGQSNMKGRGLVPPNQKTDPRIAMMHMKDDSWYLARHPIHLVGDAKTFLGKGNEGVGPGLDFATTVLAKNPQTAIGLIPCAVGGTSLDQWKKGSPLYQDAIRRAKLAIQSTGKVNARLRAALWLQGESDINPKLNATYEARLVQFIDDLRADLQQPNLPFIACTIGEMVKPQALKNTKAINQQLLALPEKRPLCACVDARDVTSHIGDQLHFDTAAQQKIGKRFAEKYLELFQKDSKK